MLWQSRPIDEVIRDPKTSDPLRDRLRFVESVRDYGESVLFLPATGSYRRFTDIGRDFVLWSVVAAEEFSTEPKLFCHPITGCVAYQGYFDQADALVFAEGLSLEGYESSVGPVAAYSTLGWFADPVLSSVLHYPDTRLAELIFHELAHELLFIPDETTFNESFATFVARAGVEQWLTDSGRMRVLKQFKGDAARHDKIVNLIRDTRLALGELYASALTQTDMRLQKKMMLDELVERYRKMRNENRVSNWDSWFEEGLNNAKLASVGSYHDEFALFASLFEKADRDFEVFYLWVRAHAESRNAAQD